MNDKDQKGSSSFLSVIDVHEKSLQAQGSYMVQFPEAADTVGFSLSSTRKFMLRFLIIHNSQEGNGLMQNQPAHLPSFDSTMNNSK